MYSEVWGAFLVLSIRPSVRCSGGRNLGNVIVDIRALLCDCMIGGLGLGLAMLNVGRVKFV